jgi:peptidyl-prolyl cis-trans isomerase B (cyclophilin B)
LSWLLGTDKYHLGNLQGMPKANRAASTRSTRRGSARWGLTAVVAAVLLVVGAGTAFALTRHRPDQPDLAAPLSTPPPTADESSAAPGAADGPNPSEGTGSSAKASPGTAGGPTVSAQCQYLPTSDRAAATAGQRSITMPDPHPRLAAHSQTVMTTNYGAITADLAGSAAPCTVNSFLTLARSGFFTGTQCHRLTADALYVLQCGDPSGTGQGGPGYQFDDENLPPATTRPAYPRGTLAMANARPGANGSQFFLVYKDSEIDPNYSVFGRITAGMDVLDKIAAAGTDNSDGPGDGHPKLEVTINRVG